jgi:hypothetical protein
MATEIEFNFTKDEAMILTVCSQDTEWIKLSNNQKALYSTEVQRIFKAKCAEVAKAIKQDGGTMNQAEIEKMVNEHIHTTFGTTDSHLGTPIKELGNPIEKTYRGIQPVPATTSSLRQEVVSMSDMRDSEMKDDDNSSDDEEPATLASIMKMMKQMAKENKALKKQLAEITKEKGKGTPFSQEEMKGTPFQTPMGAAHQFRAGPSQQHDFGNLGLTRDYQLPMLASTTPFPTTTFTEQAPQPQ